MCKCVIIITYNNVSVHKVSFITVWCDVVYVFMCTQERERERERERKRERDTVYVASTVSHVCVYNIFKSRQ